MGSSDFVCCCIRLPHTTEHSEAAVKAAIFADAIPRCECKGLIKPDIVFFGEGLPQRFHECVRSDFKDVDLLLVMGTSLQVQPFASLIDEVPERCIRLLINREAAGKRRGRSLGFGGV